LQDGLLGSEGSELGGGDARMLVEGQVAGLLQGEFVGSAKLQANTEHQAPKAERSQRGLLAHASLDT
jgi:hypothetical protein